MHKILVPVDFSNCSGDALKTAINLAKKSKLGLHIVHIIQLPTFYNDMFDEGFVYLQNELEFKESIEKSFEDFLGKYDFKGVDYSHKVEVGVVFDVIEEYSSTNEIDLVVMGSRGSSGISELLIGSNAEKVVRFSEVPVLVIKKYKDIDFNTVVFASDFKEDSISSYKKVAPFLNTVEPELHLLKINTPRHFENTQETEESIIAFAKANNIQKYTPFIYNDNFVEEGVNAYVERVKADLIIVPTHARKGLKRMYEGSMAESIINHLHEPILSVKID